MTQPDAGKKSHSMRIANDAWASAEERSKATGVPMSTVAEVAFRQWGGGEAVLPETQLAEAWAEIARLRSALEVAGQVAVQVAEAEIGREAYDALPPPLGNGAFPPRLALLSLRFLATTREDGMTMIAGQPAQLLSWGDLLDLDVLRGDAEPLRVLLNGKVCTLTMIRALTEAEGDEQSRAHYVKASFAEDEPDPGQDEHPGWILTRSELTALAAQPA